MWPTYINFKDDKGFPDATTRVIKLAAGSDTAVVLPQFVHAGLVSDVAGGVWERGVRIVTGVGGDPQRVPGNMCLGSPDPRAGGEMRYPNKNRTQ